MISLLERKKEDIKNTLLKRASKFPTILTDDDMDQIIVDCMRDLNDMVHNPRFMLLNSPPMQYLVPDSVGLDEVVQVLFSNEFYDSFINSFGLLPLITRGEPIHTFQGINDFLVIKGNLNMLNRQMKMAPDYEHIPPYIYFNKQYQSVMVGYLPYLKPEELSWMLYENELNFINNLSWCLWNLRNSEALVTAQTLGVGKEFDTVLKYWDDKYNATKKAFQDNSALVYYG